MNLNLKEKLEIEEMKANKAIFQAIFEFKEKTGFEIEDIVITKLKTSQEFGLPKVTIKRVG